MYVVLLTRYLYPPGVRATRRGYRVVGLRNTCSQVGNMSTKFDKIRLEKERHDYSIFFNKC